jgi:hypothetical protein
MIPQKGTIRTDAGDKTSAMAGIKDRKKILPDKRFSPTKIDLKDLMGGKLVDHMETLIVSKFSSITVTSLRKAVNAGKVTSLRYLPGHIDRS